jgi:hypothetical protein
VGRVLFSVHYRFVGVHDKLYHIGTSIKSLIFCTGFSAQRCRGNDKKRMSSEEALKEILADVDSDNEDYEID